MQRDQGFTLVELVIVIIILGILAATAVPKFINISNAATISKLEGMQAAMRSGTNMIYSKAVIENKSTDEATITIDDAVIKLHSGYPVANWINGIRYIVNLDAVYFSEPDDICDVDWCGRGSRHIIPSGIEAPDPGEIGKVFPKGYSFNDECGVYYRNNADGSKSDIGLETKGC